MWKYKWYINLKNCATKLIIKEIQIKQNKIGVFSVYEKIFLK